MNQLPPPPGTLPAAPASFPPPAVPVIAPASAAAAPQQAGLGGLDLAAILHIIRTWRWLILAAGAIGLAGGVLVTLMMTPLYKAGVIMEVNPPRVEILDERERGYESSVDSYSFLRTQVGLLRSRALAERAAEESGLAADPAVAGKGSPAERRARAAGVVRGGLTVSEPDDSRLIRFAVTSPSPQLAARIANSVADSFINSGLQRRYEASDYAREFLQKQIAKARVDLENSERSLAAYAQRQGILEGSIGGGGGENGGGATSLQGQSLQSLNAALATATAQRVAAEGAYRQAALSSGSQASTSTAALRSQKATLEAQYQEKRALLKPDHPDMVALRAQIESVDRAIASERSQSASASTAQLLAAYRAAQSAENALRSQVASLKGEVLDLRGRTVEYSALQRDVDTNRGLYEALLQRYKNVGVGSGIGSSPVTIVDRAQVPTAPFRPNLSNNLLIGLMAGLIGGIALAVLLEFLNDTVKTREDVRTKLHTACLGVIPRSPPKATLVAELEDQQSQVSEAYSAVLASLRFAAEGGTPKVFLMTSARPSEGKSSSALALAHNFARRGDRVLLIDADLRRPAFSTTTKASGLTELLTSEDGLRDHVARTQHANLWLLPGGSTAPNPADLLATARFTEILAEAADKFDRVIVDGPPILGLADATLLSAAVMQVVLVIEAGKTRTRAARESIDRVRLTGAHMLGVVLTKSTTETSAYGYGYGYGYGYRYAKVEGRERKEPIMLSDDGQA